jgi:hypothetical protein
MTMFDIKLDLSIWYGIVAVVAGAAAIFFEWQIGLPVLVIGLLWYCRACYRDYTAADHPA